MNVIRFKLFFCCRNNYKRSVNEVQLSEKLEIQRHRRQCLCESISLVIIIIGVIFVILTPMLLIPIWVIPNQYSSLLQILLWVSLGMSMFFLTLAALIGNVYWYYDPTSNKWKWIYHCGRGPEDHYWGSSFYNNQRINKNKPTTSTSINV